MKNLFLSFFTLLLSLTAAAQVPQGFSYQAVVRNSSGALVSNQQVGVRISILQGSATGTAVYEETHRPTTNANGLLNLTIGQGTPISGNFLALIWPQGNFYLKTEADPLGGTTYTISDTTRLLTVPYAMHAQTATRVQEHFIGELFGGGIVFYLWRDLAGVQHGLVASLNSLGNTTNPLGGIARNHTDGAINTTAAIASLGGAAASTAVGLCDAYVSGQFTDWYLPANLELKLLYDQSVAINSILDNDNNPATNGLNAPGDSWWSSTRGSAAGDVFRLKTDASDVFPGNLSVIGDIAVKSVRAIRRF